MRFHEVSLRSGTRPCKSSLAERLEGAREIYSAVRYMTWGRLQVTSVKTMRGCGGILVGTLLAIFVAEGLARAESATQVGECRWSPLLRPQELSFRFAYGYTESASLNF